MKMSKRTSIAMIRNESFHMSNLPPKVHVVTRVLVVFFVVHPPCKQNLHGANQVDMRTGALQNMVSVYKPDIAHPQMCARQLHLFHPSHEAPGHVQVAHPTWHESTSSSGSEPWSGANHDEQVQEIEEMGDGLFMRRSCGSSQLRRIYLNRSVVSPQRRTCG